MKILLNATAQAKWLKLRQNESRGFSTNRFIKPSFDDDIFAKYNF